MSANVENLMKQVKEVVEKSYQLSPNTLVETGPVYFISPDFSDIDLTLETLKDNTTIQSEFVLGPPKSLADRVKIFARRAVRRFLRWYILPLAQQVSDFNARFVQALTKLAQEQKRIGDNLDNFNERMKILEKEISSLNRSLSNGVAASEQALNHFDYLSFENIHRGPEKLVKELLRPYVKNFKGCKNVLDIGCGRGEFLELLKENDVTAYGVDIDEEMVKVCQKKGLKVIQEEGLTHLKSLDDQSLDGIFLSQLAEHLKSGELIELVHWAYKKLTVGGFLVVETPNPQSLFIFSSFYYVDFTHQKPLHPEALKFILQAAGFKEITIQYLAEVPEGEKLRSLKIPSSIQENQRQQWQYLVENTQKLNNLLYGPQHYAIIAQK